MANVTKDRFKRVLLGHVSPNLYNNRKQKVDDAINEAENLLAQVRPGAPYAAMDGPQKYFSGKLTSLKNNVAGVHVRSDRNRRQAYAALDPLKDEARELVEQMKEARKNLVNLVRRMDKTDSALTAAKNAIDGLDDFGVDKAEFEETYEALKGNRDDVFDLVTDHRAISPAYDTLEEIKNKARVLENGVKEAYMAKINDPTTRVEITPPGFDDPVEIHPNSIQGFGEFSRAQRAEVLIEVGEKVGQGKAIVDTLLKNPTILIDLEPSRKDIADVMWFLRVKGEEKAGEVFAKGAITLPDPGYLMRGYFDKCGEIYNRKSSHMTGHQEKQGGSARGIDFYDGEAKFKDNGEIDDDAMDNLLPYGMNTMLMQSLTVGSGDREEERLYIKLETEGARYRDPGVKDFAKLHIRRLSFDPEGRGDIATLPEDREGRDDDWENTKRHGWNAFKAIFLKSHDDMGMSAFREGTDKGVAKNVVKAYKKALKRAKKKCPNVYRILNEGDWSNNIYLMLDNFRKIDDDETFDGDDETRNLVENFGIICMNTFEDSDSRVGGEVVLQRDDFGLDENDGDDGDEGDEVDELRSLQRMLVGSQDLLSNLELMLEDSEEELDTSELILDDLIVSESDDV